MIEKIISNGQSGAAITALDMAIKLGLDHGGWCREGQGIADRYQLERVPGTAYRSITERCVDESDGSLFFSKTAGISLALESLKKTALRQNKPLLIHNLVGESGFSSSRKIAAWITDNHIKVLHVDGEADDLDARLSSGNIAKILEATFFLSMVDTGTTSPWQSVVQQERFPQQDTPPETIEAALNHLESTLSLKDKATIANMVADELVSLQFSLGDYINSHFDLFTSNAGLLKDCRQTSGRWELAPQDAAAVIIRALWDRLRATCRIRIVR